MSRKRPTIADLRALKGKMQHTMLRVETLDEAAAAEIAGVDIVSVPTELVLNPRYREVAPSLFTMPGGHFYDIGTTEDFLRWAMRVFKASADAVYCNASLKTVRCLADEGIPVIGHVGLVPSRATWTGGFKAVGKTAETAMRIYEDLARYEAAGAVGVEIEVVPAEVARELSQRTSLILFSMGAGPHCDAQYLFADDILGQNRSHVPRHSKIYRNFVSLLERLQEERIGAFKEYVADVKSGSYPEERHLVHMLDGEFGKFMKQLVHKHGK